MKTMTMTKFVVSIARRYHVEREDALQELALWQLDDGKRKTHLSSRVAGLSPYANRYGTAVYMAKVEYYDAPIGDDLCLIDLLPSSDHGDPTRNKVFQALKWWMQKGVITQQQAIVIFLHVADEMSFREMYRLSGVSRQHCAMLFDRGIHEIRKYVGVEA